MDLGYIDWRGVTMAMAQLKELSEPSKFQTMEKEYVLRREQENDRRAWEHQENVFNTMYNDWKTNNESINTIKENLNTMNIDMGNLKPEDQSDPFNISSIWEDNDYTSIEGYAGANVDLRTEIERQLKEKAELTNISNNVKFGETLFDQGINIPNVSDDGTQTRGFYIDSEGNKVEDWDTNADLVLDEAEYSDAIDGTIRMMEEQYREKGLEFDSRGIREGFWSKYNKLDNMEHQLDMAEKFDDYLSSADFDASTLPPELKAKYDAR